MSRTGTSAGDFRITGWIQALRLARKGADVDQVSL